MNYRIHNMKVCRVQVTVDPVSQSASIERGCTSDTEDEENDCASGNKDVKACFAGHESCTYCCAEVIHYYYKCHMFMYFKIG
jgi:hypothetical protein